MIILFYHDNNRKTGHLLSMFPAEGLDCFLLRWWISFLEEKKWIMYKIIAEQNNQIVWGRKINWTFQNSGEKCSFKYNAKKKSHYSILLFQYIPTRKILTPGARHIILNKTGGHGKQKRCKFIFTEKMKTSLSFTRLLFSRYTSVFIRDSAL